MTGLAADPATMPPEMLWGFLPKPIAVVLAVILAIAYVISEVTGKLNGPLSKLLERRNQRQEQREVGWRARDRRVDELERAFAIQERTLARLEKQLDAADDELTILHRHSDAQNRAIRRHIEWDRLWSQKARDAGIDVPDPPPSLWVELEEEEEVAGDQLTR